MLSSIKDSLKMCLSGPWICKGGWSFIQNMIMNVVIVQFFIVFILWVVFYLNYDYKCCYYAIFHCVHSVDSEGVSRCVEN